MDLGCPLLRVNLKILSILGDESNFFLILGGKGGIGVKFFIGGPGIILLWEGIPLNSLHMVPTVLDRY